MRNKRIAIVPDRRQIEITICLKKNRKNIDKPQKLWPFNLFKVFRKIGISRFFTTTFCIFSHFKCKLIKFEQSNISMFSYWLSGFKYLIIVIFLILKKGTDFHQKLKKIYILRHSFVEITIGDFFNQRLYFDYSLPIYYLYSA